MPLVKQHMETQTKSFTLTIEAVWNVYQGDVPGDVVRTLERALTTTANGERLIGAGRGKFRSISGVDFTTEDSRA